MTPEEQRIAIAESVGFKWVENQRVRSNSQNGAWCSTDGWHHPKTKKVSDAIYDLPDYLNDLNAMHEVEKTLNDEQWERYRAELYNLMPKSFALPDCERSNIHATAAQRAEAYLKTLNLWIYD